VGRLTDRHDHPGAAVLEQTHSHRWTSCIEDGGCVTAGRCRTESPPSALDPARSSLTRNTLAGALVASNLQ
jgi:hypothetical protein